MLSWVLEEPDGGAEALPGLPPQAARGRVRAKLSAKARNFFIIIFPPKIYLTSNMLNCGTKAIMNSAMTNTPM